MREAGEFPLPGLDRTVIGGLHDMANRTCSIDGCERAHNAKGLCSMHGQRLRMGQPLDLPVAALPVCVGPSCGNPINPSPHGGLTKKYCSKLCKSRAESKRNGAARAKKRVRDVAGYQRMRYATDPEWRARRQAANSRRHALRRGATPEGSERFTLDEIYDRDCGVCHLCRKKVQRCDASMDHIIPLSLDGPHTRANVALAHRSCNSSKRERAVGEQLRLIG